MTMRRVLVVAALATLSLVVGGPDANAWNPSWRWPPQQRWDLLDATVDGDRYRAYAFDGHVHSAHSRDALHPPADVIRLAELADLDLVVFTDHGSGRAVGDLVTSASRVRRVVGQEVGGNYGHALLWNVPRDHGTRQAAADLRTLGAEAHSADGLLVLAHPGWWIPNRGRDPRRWMSWHALRSGGVAADVDAVELWNGVYPRHTQRLIEDWDSLLRAGLYVPLVANSDFHRTYAHRLGTPRNVFFCPPSESDLAACLTDAVRVGRLYVTDGPVVSFVVDGELPGGIVSAQAGARLSVEIRARAPEGGELRLVAGGEVVRRAPLSPGQLREIDWSVRAPTEDGGLRVEIHRPPSHPDPHVPFSLITNPVRVDVGAARADHWRGPPDAQDLPAPDGFRRLAGSDRFQRFRFLTPVVGPAPSAPELRRARAAELRRRHAERLGRRDAQIDANSRRWRR